MMEIVAAAEAIWAENIKAEDGDQASLFERNEWGWAVEKHPDYCGHFAACAARLAGVDRDVCYYVLPSTDRLAGRVASANKRVDPLPSVEPADLQPGDIVVVNPTKKKPWGTHITIATGAPDERGYFPTIEGNAYGKRADGSNGKGVVKKYRTLAKTARVYRL